jgi:dTDP-4-amino-4,6-dideoxygalactose transaminase
MEVKYLDLAKQFKNEEFWIVFREQFETCQFIMGQEVEKFESNFAKLCQTSYALGVNSGTDAIFLALKALDIGSGDEVITVPNSFVASAGAIVAAGAIPVFVDVGPDYNIDVDLITSAINKRTKAILPVHLTGNPAEMLKIMEVARENNLYVIEDAAQAVSATIKGQPVGSFGDVGCFSLHPLKNLNVCGDGGVITTNSEEIFTRIRLLRNHGLKNRDEIEYFGYNSRLDTIQAQVANYVMGDLGRIIQKRQKNALIYNTELKHLDDFVILPPQREGVMQVYHTYVILVKKRKALIDYLNKHGVETKVHYPVPIHLQVPCRKLGYKKNDYPVCEKQVESILSLPIHQHLTDDQIYYVTDLIKGFYMKNGA